MTKFASRIYMTGNRAAFDKREIDKLQALAQARRDEAMRTKNARIDALAARMEVNLHPSPSSR